MTLRNEKCLVKPFALESYKKEAEQQVTNFNELKRYLNEEGDSDIKRSLRKMKLTE